MFLLLHIPIRVSVSLPTPQCHDFNARFIALKMNGVQRSTSVCRHAQSLAYRTQCLSDTMRTGRAHSFIHTTAPSRRVPFTFTANTSRCGLSVPDPLLLSQHHLPEILSVFHLHTWLCIPKPMHVYLFLYPIKANISSIIMMMQPSVHIYL